MTKDVIVEIIENITEMADEIKENGNKSDIDNGQLIGYAESLSIIKAACAGYDLKDLKLDYDIDKKYL